MALLPMLDLLAERKHSSGHQLLAMLNDLHEVDITEPEPGFLVGPLNMDMLFDHLIVEHYPTVFSALEEEWAAYATPFFVDDHPAAVITRLKPVLEAAEGTYVVTITRVLKAHEPESGGWRWHKWGPYLGTQNPQCEYLYDEPDIDEVALAHIHQVQPLAGKEN